MLRTTVGSLESVGSITQVNASDGLLSLALCIWIG